VKIPRCRSFQKKIALATEAGITSIEVLKTNLKQMVRDEQVDKMVQECVVKNTPEDTLTAYEIFKCLHHRQERNSV
jgi:Zn ribbon nucleic-acid-binding protein